MCGNVSTETMEASQRGHANSDIKGLLGELPEIYESWTEINHMTTWDIDARIEVSILQSPEGKVRAYCHACQSEYCIHAWEGLQGALKSVALSVLEMECGDFIDAIKILKGLPPEEKERLLSYRGIDIRDLNNYNYELIAENNKEIQTKYGDTIKDFAFFP